jgi:hypothetical protein
MLSLPPPSTAATVDDAAIKAVGSIPLLPLSTTTTIATVEDHHCLCHTVNDNDHQKPAVVVHHCQRQRWSSSMEAAVNGNWGDGGLC